MTNFNFKKDSVSNWIVSGSEPTDNSTPDELFVVTNKATAASRAQGDAEIQDPDNDLFGLLSKKRPNPFVENQTIDPAVVFGPYFNNIRNIMDTQHNKKRKISLIQEFRFFPNDFKRETLQEDDEQSSNEINVDNFCVDKENEEYEDEQGDIVEYEAYVNTKEEEEVNNHHHDHCKLEENVYEQNIPILPKEEEEDEEEEEELEKHEVKPNENYFSSSNEEEVLLTTEITFGKRGNGNQPWANSCIAPDKIGKMRRINVNYSLNSPSSINVNNIAVLVKTVDNQPDKHPGKLVLCTNDRCCEKVKEDGKKKPIMKCVERKTELMLPINPSFEKKTIELYLKPEWNGLGPNKIRPKFTVTISLVNLSDNSVINELLSWDIELQSHKFESSKKAEQMENEGRASKRDISAIPTRLI